MMAIVWDPVRHILETTRYTLSWYEVCFVAGFVAGYLLARREVRDVGVSEERFLELIVLITPILVFFAHVVHGFFYKHDEYMAHPGKFLDLTHGGFASHGALLGILLTLWTWTRVRGYRFSELLDRMLPAGAIWVAFVRLGNLIDSDVVGRVTDVPWAFRFVQREGPDALPRHPSPIYEILTSLLLLAAIYAVYRWTRRRYRPYLPTAVIVTLYFVLRFVVEFWKEGERLDLAGMSLTMGQILSIPFALLGAGFFVKVYRDARKARRAA